VVCRFTPGAALNAKVACVTLRDVAKPATVTVMEPPLDVAVTLEMEGAAAPIRMVALGAGDGVTSCVPATSRAVTVIVPATVPVCTPMPLSAAVEPAGIVNCAVRPPLANCTEGSSPPESGVKVSVRFTVTATGNADPSPICNVDCVAGLPVDGNPEIVTVESDGSAMVRV